MEKVVHDFLTPIVRSFICDWGFALSHKLGKWLDAKLPNRAVKAVLGLALGFATIAAVVAVTALAGF